MPSPTDLLMPRGPNERGNVLVGRRLGRLPRKSKLKALLAKDFIDFGEPPLSTRFWRARAPFAPRSFGNLQWGDCTRAKQANAMRRMERLEVRRTAAIDDAEVVRVYREMCVRRYGSDADNGAYETDALDDWRNKDTTFRDTKGRPLTIDAYLRINASDTREVKGALATAKSHGIAICLNLPWAFAGMNGDAQDWYVPEGQPLVGDWMPGSWGGHSMWAYEYDAVGLWLDHTWDRAPQRITWPAFAAYCDEAHLVIDSVDEWRAKHLLPATALREIVGAVNDVSDTKLPPMKTRGRA